MAKTGETYVCTYEGRRVEVVAQSPNAAQWAAQAQLDGVKPDQVRSISVAPKGGKSRKK